MKFVKSLIRCIELVPDSGVIFECLARVPGKSRLALRIGYGLGMEGVSLSTEMKNDGMIVIGGHFLFNRSWHPAGPSHKQ